MNNFKKRVLAIKELYPEVTSNTEDTSYDNDGDTVAVDETAVANKIAEMDTARAADEQSKEDAKVSGNQKLLDLGLTQAEATALTGYKPSE